MTSPTTQISTVPKQCALDGCDRDAAAPLGSKARLYCEQPDPTTSTRHDRALAHRLRLTQASAVEAPQIRDARERLQRAAEAPRPVSYGRAGLSEAVVMLEQLLVVAPSTFAAQAQALVEQLATIESTEAMAAEVEAIRAEAAAQTSALEAKLLRAEADWQSLEQSNREANNAADTAQEATEAMNEQLGTAISGLAEAAVSRDTALCALGVATEQNTSLATLLADQMTEVERLDLQVAGLTLDLEATRRELTSATSEVNETRVQLVAAQAATREAVAAEIITAERIDAAQAAARASDERASASQDRADQAVVAADHRADVAREHAIAATARADARVDAVQQRADEAVAAADRRALSAEGARGGLEELLAALAAQAAPAGAVRGGPKPTTAAALPATSQRTRQSGGARTASTSLTTEHGEPDTC